MSPKGQSEEQTAFTPSQYTGMIRFTMSEFVIFPFIVLGSIVTYGSGLSMFFFNDVEKVWFMGEWYRVFTAMLAVYDWMDFLVMLAAIWTLWYWLPLYERRFSTLFVVYEFVKVNITLHAILVSLYVYMFWLTTMRNFLVVSGGIVPYALFIFLKQSKYEESSSVWFFCAPFPVTPFLRALIFAAISVWFGPEPHSCIIVTIYWLITCGCRCRFFPWKDGPLCPVVFRRIESILPQKLTASPYFMSIGEKSETSQLQGDSQIQLNKRKDSQNKAIQT